MKEIILLSDKSSGSTIFQYELLKHKDVKAIKYTPYNDHETLFWMNAAVLLDLPVSDFFNGRHPVPKHVAKRAINLLHPRQQPIRTNPTTHDIFNRWSSITKAHGPIFFEKSPHHLNHWAALSLLFEYEKQSRNQLYFIGLVRNPLAVVYSTRERWFVNPNQRQYKWYTTYKNLRLFETYIADRKYILIRYEDLIQKPVEIMERVCKFCEIEVDHRIGQGVHSKSKNKFQNDPTFNIFLDPRVRTLAESFGYSKNDLNCNTNPIIKSQKRLYQNRKIIFIQYFIASKTETIRKLYLKPAIQKVRGQTR